jgi:hypothetical protein
MNWDADGRIPQSEYPGTSVILSSPKETPLFLHSIAF